MTKTKIAKRAASVIVGFGTGKIVNSIIKTNVPSTGRLTDKVLIGAATFVLAEMSAEASCSWSDAKIDAIVTHFSKKTDEVETVSAD